MPVRALLLDFDGLICDTERAVRRSWQETYAGLGLVFPGELWRAMVGRSAGEAIALADLGAALGRPVGPDVRRARLRRKHALCDAEPLRPGVLDLLRAAARHGAAVAVVSSSRRAWVEPHLVRLGVRDHFRAVITGDLTPRHKPAPDLYLLALRRLGVTAAEAVAFEDSPVGVRAARSAGLRCVAVPGTAAGPDELSESDVVLASIGEFRLDTSWPSPTVEPSPQEVGIG
jgi:HAD superfamily hydrolase (TIGR01509 family)